MNKRSQAQQNGEATGFTRKSAASAKPARAAAASVRVVPASAKEKRKQSERGESLAGLSREEKRARKREQRLQEDRIYAVTNELLKDDPDYKSRRRIFWGLLAVGVVATIVVWVAMMMTSTLSSAVIQPIQIIGLVIAYACIIGTFVYDLIRIRPLRNDARHRAEGMSESKLISVLEKSAAADEEKRASRPWAKKKK